MIWFEKGQKTTQRNKRSRSGPVSAPGDAWLQSYGNFKLAPAFWNLKGRGHGLTHSPGQEPIFFAPTDGGGQPTFPGLARGVSDATIMLARSALKECAANQPSCAWDTNLPDPWTLTFLT